MPNSLAFLTKLLSASAFSLPESTSRVSIEPFPFSFLDRVQRAVIINFDPHTRMRERADDFRQGGIQASSERISGWTEIDTGPLVVFPRFSDLIISLVR